MERRGEYEDVAGFCFSASLDAIKEHGYVLTPGRFVGAEDEDDDGVPFEERFDALRIELEGYFQKSRELEHKIMQVLSGAPI